MWIQSYRCGSKWQVLATEQVSEYINLLNAICQKNGNPIMFTSKDFKRELYISKGKKIWQASDEGYKKINRWLFEHFPDLKQRESIRAFRFLPYSRFDELFRSHSLRMSSMAANWKFNGPGEYKEYFKAISLNYDKSAVAETAAHTFLLCFTSDWNQRYMWENYVNNYEGFCLEVDIMPKGRKNRFWNFREVSYKAPNNYKFIANIIDEFKRKYNLDVILPWSSFACIYKGPRFFKEKEMRIYLSEDAAGVNVFREMYARAVGGYHKTKSYVDEDGATYFYIDMPLNSRLFEVKIRNVYLGAKINPTDLRQKENTLRNQGVAFEKICMCDPRLV